MHAQGYGKHYRMLLLSGFKDPLIMHHIELLKTAAA